MNRLLAGLLAVLPALAAGDTWNKVRELKGGTELRIFRKGAARPLIANMDQATEDKLMLVIKNEQVTIARDQIDRIDYRPSKSRVKSETTTKSTDPDLRPQPMGGAKAPLPGTSYSSNVSIGSKPDFETIYRRPPK
jgi:hypothetical protein